MTAPGSVEVSVAAPTRRRPMLAPLTTLAVTAALTAAIAGRSPEQPGHYPTCPFLALTGWWCPGCGSLRAIHALAHGDLGTAVDRNVLTVVAVPIAAVAWCAWTLRRLRVRRAPHLTMPAASPWVVAVVVIAFGILRNTSFGNWLAP